MENRNQNTVTYIVGGIITILVLSLFLTIGFNLKNKRNLNTEKINSETLLSDKLKVEDKLTKLNADFSALKQQSDSNDKMLFESNMKIAESEKKIKSLSAANRSLSSAKMELDELKKAKDELDKEYSNLKSERDRLLTQGTALQNSLNAIETEKNNLSTQLDKEQLYNTDNFLVTATRGRKKERVVVCALRTKKLNMTFDVPKNLTETISFRIVTPTGSIINPDDKSISWYFPMDSRNFTASLSLVTGQIEQSRQVVLSYASKVKFVKGEYKIQILSNGNNIGNCRIMLK